MPVLIPPVSPGLACRLAQLAFLSLLLVHMARTVCVHHHLDA
jgi:hypothetical protein